MTDLIPRARVHAPSRFGDSGSFLTFQREMNRLFDDAFHNFALAPFGGGAFAWPSVEVSEGDKEIAVTAELAGIDEKDIELRVEDNVLTIKGEKRTESEGAGRQYSERYYGRFERRLALPVDVDEDRAQATFKNGVLTVTLPKTERPKDSKARIPIRVV